MRLTYAVLYTSMSCKGRASKVFHKATQKVTLSWNPTSLPTSPLSSPFPLPHLQELLQLGHEVHEGNPSSFPLLPPPLPLSPPTTALPLPHFEELLQLGHEAREGRVVGGGGRLAVCVRRQDDGIHLTLLIGRR